jgi:hypothetical protein
LIFVKGGPAILQDASAFALQIVELAGTQRPGEEREKGEHEKY